MSDVTRLREKLEHTRKVLQILWKLKIQIDNEYLSVCNEFDSLLNKLNKITTPPPVKM